MKFLIYILLPLFWLPASFGKFQKGKGELIPLIKHSYKIDSLLLSFVGNDRSFAVKYPCFSVNIENDNKVISLHIESVNEVKMNAILGVAHRKNYNIGYFDLGKYKVFAYSSKKFAGLFSRTRLKNRLKFIDFSRDYSVADSSSVLDTPYLADFLYENGKFEPMYGGR